MASRRGYDANSERLFLGVSKITADGDCSHETKRQLLLGSKAMTKLDSILKSRDITLPTKVCLVKAMVFPVIMYGCKSWTIRKTEHWKIDAFELWCWRRILRVHWTARRSNQSMLKEISTGCSLKGLMLKLKFQYFGHLMQRNDSLEKTWSYKSWIFIGRTDAEADIPILWPPDAKNWLIWKDLDAGKDWWWEKGTTEEEIVGWHHWLNGHESE